MENNVQNYLLLDPANPVHCLLRQRGGMIATAVFFGSPEEKRLEATIAAIMLYRNMCECGAAGLVYLNGARVVAYANRGGGLQTTEKCRARSLWTTSATCPKL